MSGTLAAQPAQEPTTYTVASTSAPVAEPSSVDNETATKKSSTVNIPTRSTSNQDTAVPPVPVDSPRRGSKRSILNRSRNPSRSSRRSARHQKTTETREGAVSTPGNESTKSPKKRSGLMLIFGCCTRDDGLDDLKSGEPDIPPKKKQITTQPTRSTRLGEHSEGVDAEKESETKPIVDEKSATPPLKDEEKVVLDEKTPVDNSVTKDTNITPIIAVPVTATAAVVAASHMKAHDQISSENAETTHDRVTTVTDPEPAPVPVVDDTPAPINPPTKDVEMHDAPPLATADEVLDEPIQPAELQPQIALPPPPPLSKRQDAVVQPEVPMVPEIEPEKQHWLLPPMRDQHKGRKCLILDLDETLVHSSFKILNQADFTIPVEIEGQYHNVYVIKRPGVDEFMKRVGELYEVVVFTASVSKYGDPLLDQLDIHHVVHHRLFRESCYNHQGNYVKHAVPISSWFSDAHDNELLDLIPVLEDLAGSKVRDVSLVLDVAL